MPDFNLLNRHPVLRRLLLPLAAAVAFVLFLMLTFPYDTLARRIEVEARSGGADVTIGSLGPAGLFGLRAHDVRLKLPPNGGEPLPELKFDRADLSPDYLPMLLRRTSFGFDVQGYGGKASGHVAMSNDPKLPGLKAFRIDARDLDLKELPLREMTGIETSGKLQLKADLTSLAPVEGASGTLRFTLEGAAVNGGAVMGFTVPQTSLGRVEGSATIDKGVAKVDKTSAQGGDIDADVDGTIRLRPLLSLSQGDLHLRFRPTDKWLNANQMIKGAMGLIQNARQGDGSYVFTMSGPLAHMNPRPGR